MYLFFYHDNFCITRPVNLCALMSTSVKFAVTRPYLGQGDRAAGLEIQNPMGRSG